MIPRAPNIIDDQEIKAVERAHNWARAAYRAAQAQPALGRPWGVYCRTFDHELWMDLARARGVWT